jgi:subfamily B ATP-binding cassette protein MsbA
MPTTATTGALALGFRATLRHPALAGAFLVATVAQGALQGGLVWALREVLRRLAEPHGANPTAIASAALVIFALWVLRSASTYVGEMASVRLGIRVEIESMRAVIAKLLTLPVRFFEKNSQGDIVLASYFDLAGVRSVTVDVGNVVLYASRLAGLAVVACLISPKLAVVGLVIVPLGALPAQRLGRRITEAAQQHRDSVRTLYDHFLQVSSGIRTIKVNRAERAMVEKAREGGEALYRHNTRQHQSAGLSRLLLESVSGLGLITVLTIGGREVGAGRLDWQSLMGLLVAMMAVYAPVLGLLQVYGRIRSVMPNLDRVDRILGATSDVADAPDAMPLHDAPQLIELQNVSFAYDREPVLRDVSATFHRGEVIGVVGPSGSGKSTLLALLLRFYDPTGGRILLDGVDLRLLRHGDLMDACAIVLQEPFLVADTVANNIRAARPGASMDDVIAAAKAANIHDEVMLMDDGYDTVLGHREDGRGISVGQKQRLCIAAALLKNAPILFLDEATSNLDAVSERAVQVAIERLMRGRTTFVVAHRLSTLRAADRILVLDQGRVAGMGKHEELLRVCGTYRRLWSHQAEPAAAARLTAAVG